LAKQEVPQVSSRQHRFIALALALIAVAILAPAASARLIDNPALPAQAPSAATARPEVLPNPDNQALPLNSGSHPVNAPSTSSGQVAPVAATPGFDWGDAGIGAGAAFALTMIGLGGVLVLNNRHHREERPATTA
jgi:hypothetical protein